MIKDYKVAYASFNPKICSNMMKKYFKKLDHNCIIKNITNETITKESQENMILIQKEKENIKEISNNFSNKLNNSIDSWENLRNVFINKSNEYYHKQYELLNQKNAYLVNEYIKMKNNNKIYTPVLSLVLKISFIIYIITIVYQNI
ncbi:hypothetical protein H8356DRAFT_1740527 [Neocallimastix lanati (nom. inval.)]|uniref:Uncharacterized protein n=1 Tax=Neocallimastix californiae TaxID=1754190 RepID=A0A1Y2DRZ5_9FUNG|nr:hypothetical protein H8356DRAFT_1740527 [Neocallimastix sp. JGI-2020a]ORY61886.1 hypothetical protein LY90DRAFT_238528 [Neocallimastix californiae]|eukprot:ORY61886.1 hypothetical protein LY90DRAFT_238528 [Neocallimastix californiae]